MMLYLISDTRRPAGVVLDRADSTGHADLVALEVDDADEALRATATVPDGDLAPAAATELLLARDQRLLGLLLRDLIEGEAGGATTAGRGGAELLNWHMSPYTPS